MYYKYGIHRKCYRKFQHTSSSELPIYKPQVLYRFARVNRLKEHHDKWAPHNEQLSTRTLETERGVTDYSQNDESEVCASFFVGGGIEMSFSIVVNFFLVEAETRRRWDIFQAEVPLY